MSVSGTINILLFFLHLAGVLISAGVLFYLLSIWTSGRQREPALFPYTEIELAIQILGASLAVVWLTTLPVLTFRAPIPANYFSSAGVSVLAILTFVCLLATWLILQFQDQVTSEKNHPLIHPGFRIVVAATIASLLVLTLLLLPPTVYGKSIATLYAGEVIAEIIGVFAMLFFICLAAFAIIRDSWLNRAPAHSPERH